LEFFKINKVNSYTCVSSIFIWKYFNAVEI